MSERAHASRKLRHGFCFKHVILPSCAARNPEHVKAQLHEITHIAHRNQNTTTQLARIKFTCTPDTKNVSADDVWAHLNGCWLQAQRHNKSTQNGTGE